jgi:hypothetical protein
MLSVLVDCEETVRYLPPQRMRGKSLKAVVISMLVSVLVLEENFPAF